MSSQAGVSHFVAKSITEAHRKGHSFSPDIVALATGFDTVSRTVHTSLLLMLQTAGIQISGREGYAIGEDRSQTSQYLGVSLAYGHFRTSNTAKHQIATPGFPNMFVMLGSNTSPGISAVNLSVNQARLTLQIASRLISRCRPNTSPSASYKCTGRT